MRTGAFSKFLLAPGPLTELVLAPAPLPQKCRALQEYGSEWLRERLEYPEECRLLAAARDGRDVCWSDEGEDEPLVTLRIATYNRGKLVVERAVASALAQTYRRIEVLVVGDGCDPATVQAMESVRDPRVRFVNLATRGTYPSNPKHLWMVAGSAPMNLALALARGAWIAPCDDDDELSPDHVEVLLDAARSRRLEMVYSQARRELQPGEWGTLGGEPLERGRITHGSVLYSLGLRFMRHSNTSWKMNEPSDWNLWKRMRNIGVRIGFVDRITYTHYLEGYRRGDYALH